MRVLLGLLLLFCGLISAGADPLRCAVCNQTITDKFVWQISHLSLDKRSVCLPCSKLTTLCFVCGFPVKSYTTLEDGRLICEQDAPTGLTSPQDAEQIFRETKRDVMRILAGAGVLPDRNVKVLLVDKRQMERAAGPLGKGHAKQTVTMGLTSSRLVKNDDWEHTICVLDHLPPSRFAAVCAHEYSHAWIAENVRKGRKLDADSMEGFCEWISYKVMSQRNEALEKKIILENEYTRGQIDAFVKADENFRSYEVIKWIKEGVDNQIDSKDPSRVLALEREPAGPLWITSAPSPVPSTLMLRGISGSANRRFALINDRTLLTNETAKVRVGDTNVVLKCLAIGTNWATVRILGAETNIQLFLNPGRERTQR